MSKWSRMTPKQKNQHRERRLIRWSLMGENAREKVRARWRKKNNERRSVLKSLKPTAFTTISSRSRSPFIGKSKGTPNGTEASV